MAGAMADELENSWEPEEIPDEDELYMRIYKDFFLPDGTVAPGAFRDQGGGMSTNWSRYSDPQTTRQGSPRHPPEAYGVISMSVGKVRNIPDQIVQHSPDWANNNRAHTDVIGNKKTIGVRERFVECSNIRIRIDPNQLP